MFRAKLPLAVAEALLGIRLANRGAPRGAIFVAPELCVHVSEGVVGGVEEGRGLGGGVLGFFPLGLELSVPAFREVCCMGVMLGVDQWKRMSL